jgi:hypothetical protein
VLEDILLLAKIWLADSRSESCIFRSSIDKELSVSIVPFRSLSISLPLSSLKESKYTMDGAVLSRMQIMDRLGKKTSSQDRREVRRADCKSLPIAFGGGCHVSLPVSIAVREK